MKVRFKARALSAAVVMTTAVVIVLAVLQYRWSNELTEATGVRLADTLQLSIVNWHSDLLRNFLEVSLMMSPDSDGSAGEDPDRYVRRFGEWKAVARYPDLIANIYLWQGPDGRALRLNRSTNHFEPSEWPFPDVLNVHAPPGTGPQTTFSTFSSFSSFSTGAVRGWWFDPRTPVLIRPAPRS